MHTCILSHGLKRSWQSCSRRVGAGNKNTQHVPSTKTERDYPYGGLKKNKTNQKRSYMQKSHEKLVNPRYKARNAEETKPNPTPNQSNPTQTKTNQQTKTKQPYKNNNSNINNNLPPSPPHAPPPKQQQQQQQQKPKQHWQQNKNRVGFHVNLYDRFLSNLVFDYKNQWTLQFS